MSGEPSPLDPAEKVDLWRQRFSEAQAAAEEFILGEHGEEGLAAWIQANSRITAELLRVQRPPGYPPPITSWPGCSVSCCCTTRR